jgi:drug/metabolite transporter (DMT)-like permease
MMAIAGVAWGIYSIKGRGEADALGATAANFLLTLVFVVMLSLLTFKTADISTTGVVLAIASGALTSGIGYVVWYAALESLSAMRAALVQLSVPVIAATGGALLLSEPLSLQLMIASALVLGGISFALVTKTPAS